MQYFQLSRHRILFRTLLIINIQFVDNFKVEIFEESKLSIWTIKVVHSPQHLDLSIEVKEVKSEVIDIPLKVAQAVSAIKSQSTKMSKSCSKNINHVQIYWKEHKNRQILGQITKQIWSLQCVEKLPAKVQQAPLCFYWVFCCDESEKKQIKQSAYVLWTDPLFWDNAKKWNFPS